MQNTNLVVKNTGILYIKMAITMFISLYTTRLILNALGAKDYGIFNVVAGAIAMLTFLNAAMAGATQRFMSFAEGKGDTDKLTSIFNVTLLLHFAIALIIVIFLEFAGYFMFHGILNIAENRLFAAKCIYQFMIFSTMFSIMTVPYEAILNAHENMLYYSIVGIIESILKLIVALVIVYILYDRLVIYGLLMAGISLIVMIIMRVYCHKKYIECIFAPARYFDKKLMIEMTSFAGWSFLGSASSMLGTYGLGIVLNHFFGTILNAANGIAGQLNGQLLVFSNNMMKALNPAIVKAEGRGDRKMMLKLTMTGSKFSFFLFSVFVIPFIIETPYILHIWLKNVPEWTVVFCRFYFAKTLIEQLTLSLHTSINAQGNIRNVNIIKSVLNIIPLPLTYFSFKFGGQPYMMYVIPIFIVAILGGMIVIYFTMKNCGMKLSEFLNVVIYRSFAVFILTFAIGSIPLFIYQENLLRLLLVILISTISFCLSLYFIGFTTEDKSLLIDSYNTIKKKILKK